MITELIVAGASFFHPQVTSDSLGVETVNGKIFVIHKVSAGETLFAISKRYGSSVDAVLQSNPGVSSSSLEVGQILKVPYTRPINTSTKTGNRAAGGTVHKVAAKETMFSIAQKYSISVDELKQWNNLTNNTLSIGQELVVRKPTGTSTTTTPRTTTPVVNNNNTSRKADTHTVASGETLYSIARQYSVTVTQLRSWNTSLQSDELQVGQTLRVAESGKTEPARQDVATTTPVTTTTPTTPVRTQPTETKPTTTTPVERQPEPVRTPATTTDRPTEPAPKPTTSSAATIRISESVKNSDEILESGLAELIEGTEGNRKYLALHRTAPAGTILKVRNEMNNREVFVRVMGKLPDNGSTDKVVIRISKSAYDRLGAIDPKFRVEVTYYK